MPKFLFNDNWEFAVTDNGSSHSDAEKLTYKKIDVPHDFLISDTKDLYRSADGWYRKKFRVSDTSTKDYILVFDGVYMNSTVFINGSEAYSQTNGYASFCVNISDMVHVGENTVEVCVRHQSPCSRWYSGAGIFRNVWLDVLSTIHFVPYGIYISSNPDSGQIYVSAEVSGSIRNMPPMKIVHAALSQSGEIIAKKELPLDHGCVVAEFSAEKPFKLWSLRERNLYTLRSQIVVVSDNTVLDSADNIFGFRKAVFDPDNGFSLNGTRMKLKGVCLHHDLGLFGAAFNRSALRRQLEIMKEMGVNAIRTSHNPPAPELIFLCDEMGFLVDDECFDMWEMPKTEFDNARFFKDTAHKDVMSWIKRDRNHPSVIMWSIGNEIYDTHASDHGFEIAEMLRDYVREYDYKKNAAVTIGSNYIEWERAQKIGKMLGLSGYNYSERCYDAHHEKYPDTVIYGSETSSEVRSRGIYHFPADIKCLSHDDNQCSSLINSCVVWGRPAESAWIEDRDRKFVCGQFVWTGIDYIGEPTPYNTKNSYFGAVDTAGIPKDSFYFYKSVWNDSAEKFVHLFPYWDFNEGQEIDIMAYTNAPCCEVFVNGRSLGRETIDRENGKTLHYHKKAIYEKGEVVAVGYDENGREICRDIKKSFSDPVKIVISPEKQEIKSDGEDVVFIKIFAVDENGTVVENARNRVYIYVEGGKLLGMDNGDSTDFEQYKTNNRRLFSGYAVCAVRADRNSSAVMVTAKSEGLSDGVCFIKVNPCMVHEGVSDSFFVPLENMTKTDIPIRKIECSSGRKTLCKENVSDTVTYRILPENATYSDISFKTVTPHGADSPIADAVSDGDNKIKVTAKGDGEFLLRICANNGSEFPQIISEVPYFCEGLGEAVRSPYDFVRAETFNEHSDSVNFIGNGALAGFGNGGYAVYDSFDFGRAGTRKIILHLGHNLGHDTPVKLTIGESVTKIMFPDNNMWNGFSPTEFELSEEVKGICDIRVDINGNVTFGGFEFIPEKESTALINASSCDEIYGDDYTMKDGRVENIGNNVVLTFKDFDLGDGVNKITVTGRTENETNTVELRVNENGVQKTILLEFKKSADFTSQVFDIEKLSGKYDLSFVFLPGSKFDFESFRFGI